MGGGGLSTLGSGTPQIRELCFPPGGIFFLFNFFRLGTPKKTKVNSRGKGKTPFSHPVFQVARALTPCCPEGGRLGIAFALFFPSPSLLSRLFVWVWRGRGIFIPLFYLEANNGAGAWGNRGGRGFFVPGGLVGVPSPRGGGQMDSGKKKNQCPILGSFSKKKTWEPPICPGKMGGNILLLRLGKKKKLLFFFFKNFWEGGGGLFFSGGWFSRGGGGGGPFDWTAFC